MNPAAHRPDCARLQGHFNCSCDSVNALGRELHFSRRGTWVHRSLHDPSKDHASYIPQHDGTLRIEEPSPIEVKEYVSSFAQ